MTVGISRAFAEAECAYVEAVNMVDDKLSFGNMGAVFLGSGQ
jgi:hypothetical protein